MKRLISILLVFVIIHAGQPERLREAQANLALAGLVLAIGAVAGVATIYVMTHHPRPASHTMVLERLDTTNLVWQAVETNVIYMEPERFYEAFRAWAIQNHVQELFRVVEVPPIPGFVPKVTPGSEYSPVLH